MNLLKCPPRKHLKVLCVHRILTDGLLLMRIESLYVRKTTPVRGDKVGSHGLDHHLDLVMKMPTVLL